MANINGVKDDPRNHGLELDREPHDLISYKTVYGSIGTYCIAEDKDFTNHADSVCLNKIGTFLQMIKGQSV